MSNKPKNSSPVAIVVFGALFLGAGLALHFFTRPYPDGIQVDATVIDIIESYDADGDLLYSPRLEFELANGNSYDFVPKVQSSFAPALGSTEKVSYLPEDPSSARWLAGFYTWIVRALLIVGGAIAAIGVVKAVKRLAKPSPPHGSPDSGPFNNPQSPIIR